MARAYQHATITGAQWEDVTRCGDVSSRFSSINCHGDSTGTIMSRDTGGDTLAGLNGYSKCSLAQCLGRLRRISIGRFGISCARALVHACLRNAKPASIVGPLLWPIFARIAASYNLDRLEQFTRDKSLRIAKFARVGPSFGKKC
ncbi:hypothetical protein GQR58_029619 [Nymphon striatum]|nr:hypothetical protein GQR58_029619 [Nymphon striatum]